jgi:hypothetical protein
MLLILENILNPTIGAIRQKVQLNYSAIFDQEY